MRKLILICAILFLSSCAAGLNNYQSTGIKTDIQAVQFNTILSQYRDRPTFLSLITSNNKQTLVLKMSRYSGYEAEIPFVQSKVPEYVSMIDKFIKWSALASKNSDVFTKEIGQVNSDMVYVTFTFHAANTTSQYLSLSYCVKNSLAADLCFDDRSIDLTLADSINLKQTLINFEKGKIKQENISTIYS